MATHQIRFPLSLPHPPPTSAAAINLENVDPAYKGLPAGFVRAELAKKSYNFVMGINSVRLSTFTTKKPFPERMAVSMNDFPMQGAICPTHIIFLSSISSNHSPPRPGPDGSAAKPESMMQFPVHEIVLRANCTRLPYLPPSAAATRAGNMTFAPVMPVVPLRLPYPKKFPILVQFLYEKDTRKLRAALLPENWQADTVSIAKCAFGVKGLYDDARMLGVVDEGVGEDNKTLYDVVDEVWKEVLEALKEAMKSNESKK